MYRRGLLCCVAVMLVSAPALLLAKGGAGGGGSTKPVTYRYTGTIVKLVEAPEGVYMTLGTSYYPVGTVLINADTKIKLNGDSNVSVYDLHLGDIAEVDYYWPSRIAAKIEATGAR